MIVWYVAPFTAFLTRGVLCLWFRSDMSEVLTEDEQDREAHRTHILALAGFSFSALLALVILEATMRAQLQLAIYYLLVSFLCFLSALNIQGYKARRWQDQLGTALVDAATLSLVLSVVNVLYVQRLGSPRFAMLASAAALLAWVVDHVLRVRFQWAYLKTKGEVREDDAGQER